MGAWKLTLLGSPRCQRGEEEVIRLERKPAALLAYLALEGPTSRSRLAGLLWPNHQEAAARNNLRQLLFSMHKFDGLLVVTDPLELAAEVWVDVCQLVEQAASGQAQAAPARSSGELLATYEYDDSADFAEWLLYQRERVTELGREVLEGQAEQLERAGQLEEALACAQVLVQLEPVSEVNYRRLMRLNYLRGDRAAALGAFRRCQEVLARELDVAPLAETLALARQIEQTSVPRPATRRQIPLSVLRPPLLVGREQEWARLEEAYQRGRLVLVSGAEGVGKTRLIQDFAASKGPYLYCRSRPGDAGVPFASQARLMRQVLKEHADVALPAWVRFELSRLLPELARDPLPPLAGEADKLRFYDAQGEVLRLVGPQVALLVMDDLHLSDAATVELGLYLTAQFAALAEAGTPVRAIVTFRPERLPAAVAARLEDLRAAESVAFLELEPLGEAAATAFFSAIELPLEGLREPLWRVTEGNPLHLVESLKDLWESGLEPPLRLPAKAEMLLSQRLARLSMPALRFLQLAAITQEMFSLDLAQAVLETDPLRLAESESELEAAQMLSGLRFSHDLLAETVARATPGPIATLFHARTAAYLEDRAVPPALLARHWEAAGEPAKALPLWLAAAEDALRTGAWEIAADFSQRALERAAPESHEEAQARLLWGSLLSYADTSTAREQLEAALKSAKARGWQALEVEALAELAGLEAVAGHQATAQAYVTRAFARLPDEAAAERAALLGVRFEVLSRSGAVAEAAVALEQALELEPEQPRWRFNLALLKWHQADFAGSAAILLELIGTHPGYAQTHCLYNNLGMVYWAMGQLTAAEDWLLRSLELWRGSFVRGNELLSLSNLGLTRVSLGRFAEALRDLDTARAGYHQLGALSGEADAIHRLGALCYRAGRYAEAITYLQEALALMRQVGDPFRIAYIQAALAAAYAFNGAVEAALPEAHGALELAEAIAHPLATVIALVCASATMLKADRLEEGRRYAERAEEMARQAQTAEWLCYALWFRAELESEKRPSWAFAREALELAEARQLTDLVVHAAACLHRRGAGDRYLEIAEAARRRLLAAAPPAWAAQPDALARKLSLRQ